MTIAMLALAGFPATAGFFGKIYLINAAVDNGYALARHRDRARLGGLAGLLPAGGRGGLDALAVRGPGAAASRGPCRSIAGGSPEADDEDRAAGREPGARRRHGSSSPTSTSCEPRAADALRQPEVVFVAVVCALVTLVFGIYPEPLFDVAKDAGEAIQSLI